MRPVRDLLPWAAAAILALAAPPLAAEEAGGEARAFFESEGRPLLGSRCLKCHGPKKQKAGLRLDSRAALLRGGESGPALEAGDPAGSLTLRAISYQDEDIQMPPEGKLPAGEIAIPERWVRSGAPRPEEEGGEEELDAAALPREPFSPQDRANWAFQPLGDPPLPAVAARDPLRSPVDAFVLARLEAAGIKPAPEADRRTLIRRASFDLLGLPPSPGEIERFLSDRRPDAAPSASAPTTVG